MCGTMLRLGATPRSAPGGQPWCLSVPAALCTRHLIKDPAQAYACRGAVGRTA